MRTKRVCVSFGGVASALGVLLLLVSACEPYASDPVAPDVKYAKGGNGGGRGGGGGNEDPSGFDGRFGFRIGYSRPYNGGGAPGVVNALGSTSTFIGASVSISDDATDVGYLQEQFSTTCFPDRYKSGVWTFTDGRAEFSFGARSADGSVGKSYVLALTGPPFESFRTPPQNPWPLEQDGGGSFFNATDWTLIPQGKGKKNPGCEGGSTFQSDGEDPVRVGVAGRGGSSDPPSVKVVAPFLNSPFSLTEPPATINIFDHSPAYDGLVINYLGADVGAYFGYDGSTYYDFAVDIGTEIVAAADGTVIWASYDPPFYCSSLGRVVTDQLFVAIEHEVPAEGGFQGFATVYKRLQSVAAGIAFGMEINKGDPIGVSGESGCTSYPNLHFNVRVAGPGGVDYETTYFRTRTDPYGASPTDPLDGVMHQLLWVDGQAPPLIPVIN